MKLKWPLLKMLFPRIHFFGVAFTVTASSEEQEREVRISTTHVAYTDYRGTSVQKRVGPTLQRVSYRFCPA